MNESKIQYTVYATNFYKKKMNQNSSSKCSSLHKIMGSFEFDHQNQSTLNWPHWLPSDWCIHRSTIAPHSLYYSNAKGRKFQSEKEVLEYLAKQTKKRPVTKRTKRKFIDYINKPEENNKATAENSAKCVDNPEWPAWLPQDWFIERNYENPADLYYCSPKWKKFQTKEGVLQYMEAMSKKPRKKMKKTPHIKD